MADDPPVDPPVLAKYYYKTNTDIANSIQNGNTNSSDTQGYNTFPGLQYNDLTNYERNLKFGYALNGVDLALNRVATYTDILNTQSVIIESQYNHISFFIKSAGGGGGGGGGGQYNNNNGGLRIPPGGSGGGGGGGSKFIYKLPIDKNERRIIFNIGSGGAGGTGGFVNNNSSNSNNGNSGASGNLTTINYSYFNCNYYGGNGGSGGGGAIIGANTALGGAAGTDGVFYTSLPDHTTYTTYSNNTNVNTLTGDVSGGGTGIWSVVNTGNGSNRSNQQRAAALGIGFVINNLSTYINNYNPINTTCGGNGGVGASIYTNDLTGHDGVKGQNAMVRVYFHIN